MIGKKLRFEIFRRDNFACRYCGATAMTGVVLEVDHVAPRSKGGRDVPSNLLTACEGCNAGKSDTPLSAQVLEDVPQEAFRAACEDRGVLFTGASLMEASEGTIAGHLLGYLAEDDRRILLEDARELVVEVDEAEPTPQRVYERAAIDAFGRAVNEVRNLTAVMEDLLFFLPLDLHDEIVEATQKVYDEWGEKPRRSIFILDVARRLRDVKARELLAELTSDEVAEWTEYAIGVFGEHPWGYTEAEKTRLAAKVFKFIAKEGRYNSGMCRGSGLKIPGCPRRATHYVWVNECEHCAPAGELVEDGHPVCAHHLELLAGDTFTTPTGRSLTLLGCEPIDRSEKETV